MTQADVIQYRPRENLLTTDEPWSDEPPLESDLHRKQIDLLIRLLEWLWRDRNDFYVTGNLTIYYSPNQKKSEEFRGPDFFVVLGTQKRERRSWTIWLENYQYPNMIIEFLSDSTAKTDRGLKKEIYQNTFKTPNYFWFDPDSLEFKGFQLVEGIYSEIEATEQGWLWSEQLNLYVGIYQGKLRFFTVEGELALLPEEEMEMELAQAEQEANIAKQEANIANQRANQAEQEVERLKALLKAQGIDQ